MRNEGIYKKKCILLIYYYFIFQTTAVNVSNGLIATERRDVPSCILLLSIELDAYGLSPSSLHHCPLNKTISTCQVVFDRRAGPYTIIFFLSFIVIRPFVTVLILFNVLLLSRGIYFYSTIIIIVVVSLNMTRYNVARPL